MGQPRTREFTEVLEGIKKRGLTGQETEKGRLWEQRIDWRLFIHLPVQKGNHTKRMRILKEQYVRAQNDGFFRQNSIAGSYCEHSNEYSASTNSSNFFTS
jgi:hypothetical protein